MSTTTLELEQKVAELSAKLNWLETIVQAQGIEGPWVSPDMICKIFGKGRTQVLHDIKEAEAKRVANEEWPLKYGYHYRNDGKGLKPTWKIKISGYQQFLAIAPDQLPAEAGGQQ